MPSLVSLGIFAVYEFYEKVVVPKPRPALAPSGRPGFRPNRLRLLSHMPVTNLVQQVFSAAGGQFAGCEPLDSTFHSRQILEHLGTFLPLDRLNLIDPAQDRLGVVMVNGDVHDRPGGAEPDSGRYGGAHQIFEGFHGTRLQV